MLCAMTCMDHETEFVQAVIGVHSGVCCCHLTEVQKIFPCFTQLRMEAR